MAYMTSNTTLEAIKTLANDKLVQAVKLLEHAHGSLPQFLVDRHTGNLMTLARISGALAKMSHQSEALQLLVGILEETKSDDQSDEFCTGKYIAIFDLLNEVKIYDRADSDIYIRFADGTVWHIQEGSGCNLDEDDIENGYVDYINDYSWDADGNELDGGMWLLTELYADKFQSERDVIEYMFYEVYGNDRSTPLEYEVLTEEQFEELGLED